MAKKEQQPAGENPEVMAATEEDTEDTTGAGATQDPAEEGAPTGDEHVELQGLLEDARAKADEHWNQLLRANAELENAKRRARQDIENAHKFGIEKFVLELLPVKDSLEMGLSAANNSDSDVAASLKEGVELTLKMFDSALEKFAVKEVNPLGEAFNPDLHQAMSMQESETHAPNTVMAVMQKGYQISERLLRPAMVVVAKGTARAENASESDTQVDEKA